MLIVVRRTATDRAIEVRMSVLHPDEKTAGSMNPSTLSLEILIRGRDSRRNVLALRTWSRV